MPRRVGGTFVLPRSSILSNMRFATAILSALLLAQSAALRSGVLCEQATQRAAAAPHSGHSDDSRGKPAHHAPAQHHAPGDAMHCGLMANCSAVSIAGVGTAFVPSAPSPIHALPAREFAPRSVSTAPEPPPPKA